MASLTWVPPRMFDTGQCQCLSLNAQTSVWADTRQPETVSGGVLALAKHTLQVPKPCMRGWGLPSPVLKLAPQRLQTYILLLDIMALGPGSPRGRAAVYSA